MNSFVLPVLIDLLAEQGISKTRLLENTDLEGFDLSKAQLFNAAQADEIVAKRLHSPVTGCWALSWVLSWIWSLWAFWVMP